VRLGRLEYLTTLPLDKIHEMLPFGRAHATDAKATLLQHLHILQRVSRLAHLAKLFQTDWLGELATELDVHYAPFRVLGFRGWVVIRLLGIMSRHYGVANHNNKRDWLERTE